MDEDLRGLERLAKTGDMQALAAYQTSLFRISDPLGLLLYADKLCNNRTTRRDKLCSVLGIRYGGKLGKKIPPEAQGEFKFNGLKFILMRSSKMLIPILANTPFAPRASHRLYVECPVCSSLGRSAGLSKVPIGKFSIHARTHVPNWMKRGRGPVTTRRNALFYNLLNVKLHKKNPDEDFRKLQRSFEANQDDPILYAQYQNALFRAGELPLQDDEDRLFNFLEKDILEIISPNAHLVAGVWHRVESSLRPTVPPDYGIRGIFLGHEVEFYRYGTIAPLQTSELVVRMAWAPTMDASQHILMCNIWPVGSYRWPGKEPYTSRIGFLNTSMLDQGILGFWDFPGIKWHNGISLLTSMISYGERKNFFEGRGEN